MCRGCIYKILFIPYLFYTVISIIILCTGIVWSWHILWGEWIFCTLTLSKYIHQIKEENIQIFNENFSTLNNSNCAPWCKCVSVCVCVCVDLHDQTCHVCRLFCWSSILQGDQTQSRIATISKSWEHTHAHSHRGQCVIPILFFLSFTDQGQCQWFYCSEKRQTVIFHMKLQVI